MNHIVISGHLTDKVRVTYTQDGKISAFGKIGVYNGKTKEGEQRDSMFFDLVMFGRSAELVRDNSDKGSLIIASGRLEEDKSVSQTNGQTYVNKRIVCDNVQVGVKPVQTNQAPQVPVQPAAPQQYQQPVQQYQQPMGYAQAPAQYAQPQYQAPVQQPGSPW